MLTPKQRAYLKSLANPIKHKYLLGKGEVDGSFIDMIDKGLETQELIKVSILQNSSLGAEEVSEELCSKVGCDQVSIIGRVITLYRRSKKTPKIVLPVKK